MTRFAPAVVWPLFLLASPAIVAAQQAPVFRIESKVFFGDSKEPVKTMTLFHAGRVYDFLSAPQESTVFDPLNGRFVVLDPARKVSTEVSTEEIKTYVDALRRKSLAQRHPFLKFLADPKFEETYDEANGLLTLDSPWMTYRVETTAVEDADAALQYAEFADWYAQLNAVLNPASRPPFSRLALNEALRRRQRMPVKVTLTVPSQEPGRKADVIRAEHKIIWRHSQDDQRLIDDAGEQLSNFSKLSMEEYHRPAARQATLDKPAK